MKKRREVVYDFRNLTKEARRLVEYLYNSYYGMDKRICKAVSADDASWTVTFIVRKAELRDDDIAMEVKQAVEEIFKRHCWLSIR